MKTVFTWMYILLFLPSLALAEIGAYHFNGDYFDDLKILQMTGHLVENGDRAREEEVIGVVSSHQEKLDACYEKETGRVQAIFYFSVDKEGRFRNVTADVFGSMNSGRLISCIAEKIETFKASHYSAGDRVFRYIVSFPKPR